MENNKIGGMQLPPITPVRPKGTPVQIPATGSFQDILRTQTIPGNLKFSAHAQQRLQSRNIELSQDDLKKMNDMVDKAASKGSKNSLFMMRDVAMVVSINNRTVITAVDQNSMKENVFTNIDSAAIIS